MDKGILGAKTIKQAARLMKANVFTAPELIEATFDNMEKLQDLNAYISKRPKEDALREAEEAQKRIERSKCVKVAYSFIIFILSRYPTLET